MARRIRGRSTSRGLRVEALVAAVLLVAVVARSQVTKVEEPSPFEAWDVYVDSGERPLAAYQFEFLDPAGRSVIVGVEGGEHAAFRDAPYYDAAALRKGRLIVAAFHTGKDLPRGRTRVARLHVEVRGEGEPEFSAKLMVSATVEGEEIPATVSLEKGKER